METFVSNPDTEKFETLVEETKTNVNYFTNVCDNVVKEYSKDLDILMSDIYSEIMKDDYSDEFLEKSLMKLNGTLYYMYSQLERLGIYDDMSKAASKEVYNKAYLNNQTKTTEGKNKTTVAENQAVADAASQYETTLNNIYNRAYKVIKGKIDAGYDMVNSIRKIMTKRMSESNFAQTSGILVE